MSAQIHAVAPNVVAVREQAPITQRRLLIVLLVPIVLFLPSLVSFFTVKAGTVWPEYPGILFHLALLPVVANLRAPRFVQAAGYGWIAIDVLAGVLAINGLPFDTYWPVRMGGHVLAGTWIIGSSLLTSKRAVLIVGLITGLDLGGYSFFGTVLPMTFVYPAGILIVVWLILIAVNVRSFAPPTNSVAAPSD